LFGVFDGHGGSQVSTFLEHNVGSYVSDAVLQHYQPLPVSWENAFTAAFTSLDESLPTGLQNSKTDVGGSTAVIVRVSESEIVCANCGESIVQVTSAAT
jgi:serine/threonine protein phosphatase PrpC